MYTEINLYATKVYLLVNLLLIYLLFQKSDSCMFSKKERVHYARFNQIAMQNWCKKKSLENYIQYTLPYIILHTFIIENVFLQCSHMQRLQFLYFLCFLSALYLSCILVIASFLFFCVAIMNIIIAYNNKIIRMKCLCYRYHCSKLFFSTSTKRL